MTAVEKYQRLECTGLWRASASAQLREVVVGLRDATLVLSDPRTGVAVTHWSLPAVERINGSDLPALFTAGRLEDGEPAETLEVEDSDMISALDTIHGVLIQRRPHPGRLRGVMVVSVVVAIALFALLWLPGAMIRHTASVLPQATRVQIGKLALQDMGRLTGSPCGAVLGKRAAATLALRLSAAGVGEIVVVRDGLDGTASLPGGLIVVGSALLNQSEDPEVLAGHIVAEAVRAEQSDPVIPLLSHAGLMATFRLLTTGQLPAGAITSYAEDLLKQTAETPDDQRLLDSFARVGLASTTFALAIDPSGEATKVLIDADPFKGDRPCPFWTTMTGSVFRASATADHSAPVQAHCSSDGLLGRRSWQTHCPPLEICSSLSARTRPPSGNLELQKLPPATIWSRGASLVFAARSCPAQGSPCRGPSLN